MSSINKKLFKLSYYYISIYIMKILNSVFILFCVFGCSFAVGIFQSKKNKKEDKNRVEITGTQLLVTTAFWNVESKIGNAINGLQHYSSRFKTFMNLKSNLAVYGDSSSLAHIFAARKHRNQGSVIRLVIESNYHDFEPCKSHWLKLSNAPGNYTDPRHVPTIDLGCIWLSKLWLLQKSADELPQYDWHLWLDIGLHLQEGQSINPARFPNLEKLQNLPRNKVIVSGSGFNCLYDESSNYHRQRFENSHCIAGTSFLIHRDGLKLVIPEFLKAFELCLKFFSSPNITHSAFPCLSDQILMSHMDPKLVHKIDTVGYGAVAYDLLC